MEQSRLRPRVRGVTARTARERLAEDESSPHRPLDQVVFIGFLLAVATVVDYLTGPAVTPAALYLLAVVTAAWQRGIVAGLLVALLAGALNILANRPHPISPLGNITLPLNLSFGFLALVGAAWLGAMAGRQQQLLTEQRDQFAQLNAHLDDELRAARTLQQLLVAPVPQHPAFGIATLIQPALILGGDVVDLVLTPDGRLVCALADISGKGSPAALAGAVLIGLLDDAPERFKSPAATLNFLNERLAKRLPESMFVTMFYALLDLAPGKLTYASAGHDPPLLIRKKSSCPTAVEELPPTGMVLGALPGEIFEEETVMMRPGDTLLLYTDGLTDVIDAEGERFGPDRLRELAAQQAGATAQEIAKAIADRVVETAVHIPDDISMVAIQYLGSTRRKTTRTSLRASRVFSQSIKRQRRARRL